MDTEKDEQPTNSAWHIMEKGSASAAYLKFILACVTTQTLILLSGIPWAYSMQRRVTAVETHLSIMAPATSNTEIHYHDLIQRLTKCEALIDNLRAAKP